MTLKYLLLICYVLFGSSTAVAQLPTKKILEVDSIPLPNEGIKLPANTSLNFNFELKNTLPKDTVIVLEIGRQELAQLYAFNGSKSVLLAKTGVRVPIPERSVKNNLNIIEIKLNEFEKKQLTLDIENSSEREKEVKIQFRSRESHQIYDAKQKEAFYYKYWLPFFFTTLILALLLAVIQYSILPERVFVYYFLYVTFTLIRSASALEILRFEEWIPLLYKIGYRSMQSQVFTYLSFIFYVLFIREFTDFKKKKPRLDIFFKVQLVYLALFILFDLFFPDTKYTNSLLNNIFRGLEALGLVLGSITLLMLFKVYDSINKYIIFGALSLLVIALLGQEILKRSSGNNEESEYHSNLLSIIWGIAYIVEIAFFIAALIFRQKKLLSTIRVKEHQNELLEQQLASKEQIALSNADYQTFSLPTNQGIHVFLQSDIIRLEASGSYTIFSLQNQKQTLASYTLSEFESRLDPSRFIRVHKSHIVNLHYITKYTKGDGGTITLQDGSEIPVSRSRKEYFLKKLNAEK